MFERIRFVRYALRFERAFVSDDWHAVAACFHPDARYIVAGTASEFDGETRGREAIVKLFKRMLDELDRRFDKRSPRITSLPRVRDGELTFRWSVRYALGADSTILTGTSQCRFDGGKIAELRDTMVPAECTRWATMVGYPS